MDCRAIARELLGALADTPFSFDPDSARRLLREAGPGDGFRAAAFGKIDILETSA